MQQLDVSAPPPGDPGPGGGPGPGRGVRRGPGGGPGGGPGRGVRGDARRQQALAGFRNARIQKIYGAPCPYRRAPTVPNYTRSDSGVHLNLNLNLHPNTSRDREYCAPLASTQRRAQQQQHDEYQDAILGELRPVSASRLKFNHTVTGTEDDESMLSDALQEEHDVTHDHVHATPLQPPASSGKHSSYKQRQSPLRLRLTDRPKSDRGASVLLECSDQEASHYHYDSQELGEDSLVQEERAILAISAALVDTKKTPAGQMATHDCEVNHRQTAEQSQESSVVKADLNESGTGGGERSYYDEIEEDVGDDIGARTSDKECPVHLDRELKGDSGNHRAMSSTHKELEKGWDRRAHNSGNKRAQTAGQFRHYPSSRQQNQVAEMDSLALRKIVPSYDKNYLRARPLPTHVKARRSKPARNVPVGVPETLSSLGLFMYPSSANRDKSEFHSATMEVDVPRYQQLQERQRRTFSKKKPSGNQEREHRSASATRPATAGAPTSTSPNRLQHRQTGVHPSSAGYARRVTSAVSASKMLQTTPVSANRNRDPSASRDVENSKKSVSTTTIEDIKRDGPVSSAPEQDVFDVGIMVQARYKNREQWWQGKIVARNLPLKRTSGVGYKYDIRYGDILERNVPPSRIRRRPVVGLKAKLKNIITKDVMADTLLHSEGFPDYSPDEDTSIKESSDCKDQSSTKQHQPQSGPPPPLLGSQKLGAESRRASVSQNDIMSKLVVVAAMSEGQGIDFSKLKQKSNNFLGGLRAAGSNDDGSFKSPVLRKTVTNQKSAAELNREEKEQEEKRQKEQEAQARLSQELSTIVSNSKKRIAFSDLSFEKTIGRGKFASVHQVTYSCKVHCQLSRADRPDRLADALHILDENSGQQNMDMTLAVKTPEYRNAPALYPDLSRSSPIESSSIDPSNAQPPSVQLMETIREVKALSVLNHPNIINYYGVTLEPRVCVVLELLHCSLAQVLSTSTADAEVALDNPQRILIIRDICSGLKHLHEQKFAHLDIKPHNILLSLANGGYAAKLADFGTAVELADGEVLTKPVGTSGYTAPEISMPGRYDMRADIFSFAVVMWELLVYDGSGSPPVPNPFTGKDLDEAACDAHGGVRPSLEPSCLPLLNDAVAQAWATAPSSRLSLTGVLQAIDDASGSSNDRG